jgi:hypothetical protein
MKIKSLIITLTATTLLFGMVGCKKEDTQAAADKTKEATGNVVDAIKSGTDKAVDKTKEIAGEAADKTKEVAGQAMDKAKEGVEAVKAGTEKAVDAVKAEAAKITTPAADDKAQSIIDQAKSLLDSGKIQEALTALDGLKGMTLSEAQEKLVASLREQIQKALADKASAGAGAIGNLLGK